MFEQLRVGAWACIDSQCPIRLLPHEEADGATLVFGGHDTFELYLDLEALRNLVQISTEALEHLRQHGPTCDADRQP